MKSKTMVLVAVLLATFLVTSPALAATGHVYGVVFVDANLNGVWDVGEVGFPDIEVTLESADGLTSVALMSAPTFDELDEELANMCSRLDPSAPTPCPGTWGLRPAGEAGFWWQVTASVPAGYFATTDNPQWVQAQGEGHEGLVFIGLAPLAAGGPLLPATGAGHELYAAGLMLLAGLGLTLKSRIRR
jgi:hypothetical protein